MARVPLLAATIRGKRPPPPPPPPMLLWCASLAPKLKLAARARAKGQQQWQFAFGWAQTELSVWATDATAAATDGFRWKVRLSLSRWRQIGREREGGQVELRDRFRLEPTAQAEQLQSALLCSFGFANLLATDACCLLFGVAADAADALLSGRRGIMRAPSDELNLGRPGCCTTVRPTSQPAKNRPLFACNELCQTITRAPLCAEPELVGAPAN